MGFVNLPSISASETDPLSIQGLTSDVTATGPGTVAATIAANAVTTTKIIDDAVTNAKLANMATQTIKGRTTAGTADPEDLSATQATAILNSMVGDSGAGGTKGLVPAPAAGDAAAAKFLKADGVWTAVSSLPTDGGIKDRILTTNGSNVASWKTLGNLWAFQHIVYYDPDQHADEQAAIDEAAAYGDADADEGYGVAVVFPTGDFTNIEINNNIFVIGQGIQTAFDNIRIRPGLTGVDGVTPRFCGIKDLFCANLILNAESSDAVFNTKFLTDFDGNLRNDGFYADNCTIAAGTVNGVNYVWFTNCVFNGGGMVYTLSESVVYEECSSVAGGIDWSCDDSAAHLPVTYSGGALSFKGGNILSVTMTQDGGATTVYFNSSGTAFDSVARTGECDLRVEGGYIKALTDTGANNSFLNDDYPKRVHSGTVSVTISALAALAEEDISVTISGVKAGDVVQMFPTATAMETGVAHVGTWISANDTVKVRISNVNTAAGLTGSTQSWSYLWTQITPDWS